MSKTQVYNWRIDPDVKSDLELSARRQKTSVARLLDRIVTDWLRQDSTNGNEAEIQQRLHAAADKTLGTISGGESLRASEVKERVRARLKRNHAR
jgi:hypothetical protein